MSSHLIGEKISLRIDDIAFGGEGVGRLGEFVVFVAFTVVGDVVEAELMEVKKKFGRARLIRIVAPSSLRVQPRCRYFGDCGGCQYQHMDYGEQLRVKRKQIADLFQRVGGFDPSIVSPVQPCPRPYGYRNRIMIRSQWDKFKQGLNIGFIRNSSRLVVDIEECVIAEPVLNQQIQQVRRHPPPKGGIKVVLRVPPEGWEVPPDSFFQNNFYLLPGLVGTVREQIEASGTRHLIDVYCGVGFFSIELAGSFESFAGVELDKLAIAAARKNAARRGISNGEFVAAAAEEALPEIIRRFDPTKTTVLLDPPRKGCHLELIELLRKTRPAQIIYVSCNPATMARDLNILCAESVFKLAQLAPLDMFPQTAHVESVADLRCNTFV